MAKMNPVVHFEIPGEDMTRMRGFYEGVFGWGLKNMGADMGNYSLATTTPSDQNGPQQPGAINGGLTPKSPQGIQSPSLSIGVDDIEAKVEEIKKAGGKIIGEIKDVGSMGKYVMFEDTEGNRLSLWQTVK